MLYFARTEFNYFIGVTNTIIVFVINYKLFYVKTIIILPNLAFILMPAVKLII